VVIISPFNFPLEIPLLQLMGALFMGNKVLLKVDSRVAIVMEQVRIYFTSFSFILLYGCGVLLIRVGAIVHYPNDLFSFVVFFN
jgi:hypothetical protein